MRTKIFLVDIEATARTPHSGVMTEFGVVHFDTRDWFHGVLYHAYPSPENSALPVLSGKSGSTFAFGTEEQSHHQTKVTHVETRKEVFTMFNYWVDKHETDRPIFMSDNPGFDFGWFNYHCDEANVANIFGFSSRRIGDLAAGLSKNWKRTSAWKRYRKTKHTHHPVDDVKGNAEALKWLLDHHQQEY